MTSRQARGSRSDASDRRLRPSPNSAGGVFGDAALVSPPVWFDQVEEAPESPPPPPNSPTSHESMSNTLRSFPQPESTKAPTAKTRSKKQAKKPCATKEVKKAQLKEDDRTKNTPCCEAGRAVACVTALLPPGVPPERILSTRVVEKQVRVPKLVRTRETIERIQVIPSVRRREEIVHEPHIVKETIKTIEQPIFRERLIVETDGGGAPVNDPDHDAKPNSYDGQAEGPLQYHILNLPEIEYREVPVERVIEVPEITERHLVIPQRRLPEKQPSAQKNFQEESTVQVEHERIVPVNVPVPVDHVVRTNMELQSIEAHYVNVDVPVFVPRFVEIACPVEALDEQAILEIQDYADRLMMMSAENATTSLADVDALAKSLATAHHLQPSATKLQERINNTWRMGQAPIRNLEELVAS